jgi:hypothetical protein
MSSAGGTARVRSIARTMPTGTDDTRSSTALYDTNRYEPQTCTKSTSPAQHTGGRGQGTPRRQNTRTSAHTHTRTHPHTHAHTRTHTHAHTRTRTHVHAHVHTHRRTHEHTHVLARLVDWVPTHIQAGHQCLQCVRRARAQFGTGQSGQIKDPSQ